MADINHVVLVGRLTRDAELRYTSSGIAVCNFAIAVNRRRKNGDEWSEETSFFDVVLWGRQGESLNQYLIKGKQVAIDGELRQNRWEQDGQTRSRIEIVANNLQLLGGGQGGQVPQGQQIRQGTAPQQAGYGNQQYQTGAGGQAPSAYQRRQDAPPYNDDYIPDPGNSDLDNIPF
ncbi:single-stranded DNA-binding protein [Treponema pedis]|uniref:single-stranded DNA-binding protein n=1 Tax=Treponema pedis TaxID=409322 RepID=UPI001980B4A1|nr:single-stranded DNA-binding protein [Treponema pedis]QSI04674.1 single-stranded DNA-binding protein [Treponema pedis]